MADLPEPLASLDRAITHWMAKYGIGILRIALGIVFLWFGFTNTFRASARKRRSPLVPSVR